MIFSDKGKHKGGKKYNEGFVTIHNHSDDKGFEEDEHYGRITHGDYAHKSGDVSTAI